MTGFTLLLALLAVPEPHPSLRDLDYFPCRWVTVENCRWLREHKAWLEVRSEGDPANEWDWYEWKLEAEADWRAWDALQDAHNPGYHVSVRREYLDRLRRQIGPANYYAGRMPPLARIRRFARMR